MKTFVILLVLACLIGCSGVEMRPVCRHDAVYCAIVASERYPAVRIVCGEIKIPQHGKRTKTPYLVVKHAQAQALIDGSWEYLILRFGVVKMASDQYLHNFIPQKEYSVAAFQDMVFNSSRLKNMR